jgi:hypothetical protein
VKNCEFGSTVGQMQTGNPKKNPKNLIKNQRNPNKKKKTIN